MQESKGPARFDSAPGLIILIYGTNRKWPKEDAMIYTLPKALAVVNAGKLASCGYKVTLINSGDVFELHTDANNNQYRQCTNVFTFPTWMKGIHKYVR